MNNKPIKWLLIVEDNPGDARLLQEMLNESGYPGMELTHVECLSDAEEHLAVHPVDIILLDLGLPDAQGLAAVRRVRATSPHVPLVVLTGLDDETLAAQALHDGAQDYLIKGEISTRGLFRALRYASERKRLEWLKDEFISSVSHELRTPLTSISGSLGLLMSKAVGTLPDAAMRLLAIAHANSQRLIRLVNDILDIQKMESGSVVFNYKRVAVRSLVEEAIEANRGFAEGHGVRIRLEDASAVGDVRADPDRLVQAVTNLLSNAVKFSPANCEVTIAIEKSNDTVRICVRDHGPGIPVDFKPHVFQRFAQAETTSERKTGGTGLGLNITKQIVDRLGGQVGFADAPGGGTVFHIELPCWSLMTSMAIDLDALPDAPRILLCEDDFEAAIALRKQLQQGGFATDFAYSAADALTCAAATQYYTILVDLKLPDGDGVTLILRLRELPQYREAPIIVVSADPHRGRMDMRSSRLNVLDWLSKPVDFGHLMRVLPTAAMPVGSGRSGNGRLSAESG